MRTLNVTAENHAFGLPPSLYSENTKISTVMVPLGVSLDKQGEVYVCAAEGRELPIYTVMFHPEKPP